MDTTSPEKESMDHTNLLRRAIDAASARGATYVEARYGRRNQETLGFADGRRVTAGRRHSEGWGIRVISGGAWGFASTSDLSEAVLDDLLADAFAIASATQLAGGAPVEMAPHEPVVAEHRAIGSIDPFSVSMADRAELMGSVHAEMRGVDGITATRATLDFHREVMELVTSEGTEISQEIAIVGGGYVARAAADGSLAMRSYPHHGGSDYATGGFEWFESMDFVGNAARTAREAVLLLSTDPCPSMTTTVILDPAMIGTVLHETVGHATELDRILGHERDNFGSSFVQVHDIGSFPYASPAVTVTADATYQGAAGSYGYDGEGVAAQRLPLITDGVLVGVTNSRESAAAIGTLSAGTGRVAGWSRIPMARMTNIVLQPGTKTLDELIADVDDGIYISGDATTDIDDNRELCAFGGEIGWRIRHGELAEPVARPVLFTDSHQLLRQADAVACEDESWVTGIFGCGKGQPWQFLFTGQGGPPARFRNVTVGAPDGHPFHG